MKTFHTTSIVALVASLWLAAPAHTASSSDKITETMSQGGLQKVTVKGIDLAYARPGATLAAYRKVELEPVTVVFAKNWNPKPAGRSYALTEAERARVQASVAKIVYDAFAKELQKNGGYPIVTQAGPDVLKVKANVVNVHVTAPGVLTAGRSRTYTVSAGRGTLVLELFDSQSGQILARAVDAQAAQNAGPMMISNSATNQAQGEIIASRWAKILRRELDAAHGAGKF